MTVTPNPSLVSDDVNVTCLNSNTDGAILTAIFVNGSMVATGGNVVSTLLSSLSAGTRLVNCTSAETTNYNPTNLLTNLTTAGNAVLNVVNSYDNTTLRTWSATIDGITYNTSLYGTNITLPIAAGTVKNVTFTPSCTRGGITDTDPTCGFFTTNYTDATLNNVYAIVNQSIITIRAIKTSDNTQINDRTFTLTDTYHTTNFVGNTTISLNPTKQYNFTITTPNTNTKYLNTTATLYEIANRDIHYTLTTDAQYNIDNCSTLTTQSINFTIRDTNTTLPITGSTLAAYAKVWIDTETGYKNYNLTWPTSTTFGICINTSYVLNTYAQLQYSSPGYTPRTYYLTNNTLTNTTNLINLYLDSAATNILITVIDQNAQPISNAYIYVLAYDLPTNTFTTDSIIKTGDDGTAIANAQLLTQWYELIGTKEGYVTKTSEPFVFTTTSKLFRMELITAQPTEIEAPASISCSIGYTNATRTFTLDYADSSGNTNTACLRVYKQNTLSSTLANETCATSSATDLAATIPPSTGTGSWLAQSIIQSGGHEYQCGTPITYTDNDTYKAYGTTGLVATFLLVLSLALVGIWSPVAAILMAFAGVAISLMLGIYQMSWVMLFCLIVVTGIMIFKVQQK
jgi:hypothetical protein